MTQEALKLALDALETELSIDWTNNDEFDASAKKMYEAIAAIKEASAQPEQEPVAYLCKPDENGLFQLPTSCKACKNCFPVFRHSQRTWVGLTDDDMAFLFPHGKSAWVQETVKAIEAKLKEKNT